MDSNRQCTTDFVINNLPTDQREFLSKKRVHDVISRHADVKISMRGVYIKPKPDGTLVMDNKRPLYLHIIGLTKRNLSLAIQKIQSLLKDPIIEPEDEDFIDTEKVTIGIDIFPSIFRMKAKVLGERNENVDYIYNETGGVITLRGKGSGFSDGKGRKEADEPLHIHVEYKNGEKKEKTRELILNLIETVQQDFINTYGKYYSRPRKPEIIPVIKPPNMKRTSHTSIPGIELNKPIERRNIENKSLDRRSLENRTNEDKVTDKILETKVADDKSNKFASNIEKITIGLDSVPVSFNLKSKIYGANLANVKHIEKVASALLLVEGKGCGVDSNGEESKEPPYILVKYLKPEMKESARSLIFNLIETIQQEFISLYGRYPVDPQKPKIIPIKKLIGEKVNKSPVHPLKTGKSVDLTPIPPPPPVISKPVSPDGLDNVPPPANYQQTSSRLSPLLFSNPEPTPVPRPIPSLAPPVIPPSSSFDAPLFSRLPEQIEQLPNPISNFSSQNTSFSSQSRLLVQQPTFTTSETPQSQIQTIQYLKKRSLSPVESFSEPKKFCGAGVEPTASPFTGITNVAREQPTTKGKIGVNNRYLVPVKVDAKTDVTKNKNPPKSILKKPQWGKIKNGKLAEKSDSEEEEDRKSVILIDSEEEELEKKKKLTSGTVEAKTREISVQTDDRLWQWQIKNIKCACGRFSHVLTGVRSVGVQTIADTYRRF